MFHYILFKIKDKSKKIKVKIRRKEKGKRRKLSNDYVLGETFKLIDPRMFFNSKLSEVNLIISMFDGNRSFRILSQ